MERRCQLARRADQEVIVYFVIMYVTGTIVGEHNCSAVRIAIEIVATRQREGAVEDISA